MPAKNTLFPVESTVAQRQPKTDRLILERLLKSAALDNRLDEEVLRAAHLYGLQRDDMEYILSTFKGIHDQQTLFPGHVSTAQRIVQKYAEMSFSA
jgi:hypothetical protein